MSVAGPPRGKQSSVVVILVVRVASVVVARLGGGEGCPKGVYLG